MANFIYDLVDPVELVNYVRAYENEVLREEGRIVLDSILPNTFTDEIEFRVRQGGLEDVDAAVYRAWDTPPPMTARPGITRISGELGPISRQIPLGEEERLRRDILLRGNNNSLVDAIFADAERMVRSVAARIELARGDLINDGKVTISENGLTLEADFGRSVAMSAIVNTLWTDNTSAKPLTDLLGYMETYVDTNGFEPGSLWVPRARLANFALNAEMRSYAAANGTTPSRLNQQAVNDVFASEGLPPIRVYDGQFRVAGSRVRVLPENKVFFMPPSGAAYGETRYGITAEGLVLAQKGLIEMSAAPGIVAAVLGNDNPVQTFTLATAVALPISPNPDYVMDITVAA